MDQERNIILGDTLVIITITTDSKCLQEVSSIKQFKKDIQENKLNDLKSNLGHITDPISARLLN